MTRGSLTSGPRLLVLTCPLCRASCLQARQALGMGDPDFHPTLLEAEHRAVAEAAPYAQHLHSVERSLAKFGTAADGERGGEPCVPVVIFVGGCVRDGVLQSPLAWHWLVAVQSPPILLAPR